MPILGWQTEQFPAFYSRTSGLRVDLRVDSGEEVAAIYRQQRALKLPQGLLVTAPVPEADELPAEEVEPLIARALEEAEAQKIHGKAMTPYLLARLVQLSNARTKRANESLLVHNATVAAEIAVAMADEG